MGGDKAPDEVAKAAFQGASELGVAIALVGTQEALQRHLGGEHRDGSRVSPVVARQVVGTAEPPTEAWRGKKDSSMAVGIRMVKEGRADAFVSAGNTGAIAAISLFSLGSMSGADRPAVASLYRPLSGNVSMILDIGVNVDCRPGLLLQFGRLGSAYMATVFQIERPRVALLSNGEESTKGTRLVKEAHKLMRESDLNFAGNVEGFDIVQGVADVIVTDGFTGNVVLKLAEALTGSIFLSLKGALGSNVLGRASKPIWGPPIMSVAKQWDYSDIAGAPLLGVNGNIVKTHGRSDAADITKAIALAQRMVREGWYRPQQEAQSNEPTTASKTMERP